MPSDKFHIWIFIKTYRNQSRSKWLARCRPRLILQFIYLFKHCKFGIYIKWLLLLLSCFGALTHILFLHGVVQFMLLHFLLIFSFFFMDLVWFVSATSPCFDLFCLGDKLVYSFSDFIFFRYLNHNCILYTVLHYKKNKYKITSYNQARKSNLQVYNSLFAYLFSSSFTKHLSVLPRNHFD